MAFKVGDRVKVTNEIGRQSRIIEIKTSRQGAPLYILQDGGWMGEREIELVTPIAALNEIIQRHPIDSPCRTIAVRMLWRARYGWPY